MVLRHNILVGGGQRRVELPPQHRPIFEEGAALIFTRWTALQLGVQNEWGGSKSAQKAQELLQDVIGWFYNTKGGCWGGRGDGSLVRQGTACAHARAGPGGWPAAAAALTAVSCPSTRPLADHEMCDLQELLDEALQLDFSIQAEDDSPYQARLWPKHVHTSSGLQADPYCYLVAGLVLHA